MQCRECNHKMTGVGVHDDPNSGFAYNLYQCDYCGCICKDNVWNNPGELWINAHNEIKFLERDEI